MNLTWSYIDDFLSLFYPRLCYACNRALIKEEECICTFCNYHLPQTHFYKEKENALSQIFWGRIPIETACTLFYFHKKGKVQNLIHQFKYKGKKDIGIYLGKMLGDQLNKSMHFDSVDMIVPVPLHREKQFKRGFNQSEIIARGIAKIFNKSIVSDNLVRVTKSGTQTRKARFKRWENVETVFKIHHPEEFEHKNILLIDDVITTGATLESCGQKLLAVKGVKLWIATLAIAS